MSNSNEKFKRFKFDLAFNLHFGAFNLLFTLFNNLREAELINGKEFSRFESFISFCSGILRRSYLKFYPSNSDNHESSNGVNSSDKTSE